MTVDGLVLLIPLVVLRLASGHSLIQHHPGPRAHRAATLAGELALSAAYLVVVMVRTGGRTLGKWLMGIRVVRLDGRPVTATLVLWRETLLKGIVFDFAVLELISKAWGLVGLALVAADYGCAAFGEQRALHDRFARTAVARTGQAIADTISKTAPRTEPNLS